MQLKHIFFTAWTVIALSACGSHAAAPKYVPGKPMTFPVDAASTLEHLGRNMLANCESPDASVKNNCISRMEPRIKSCFTGPTAFESLKQYKATSKVYLHCVIPNPVCHGVEITSEEQMRTVCGKQA